MSSSSANTLTRLSLGCSAFGGVFVPMTDEQCTTILRRAFDNGLAVLDTAPWYKASERVTGRCLEALRTERPRDTYQLNTKVGRYPTGKMFDFSAARVTASVLQSLDHLRTEYIDTIQVHDCEFGDEETILSETLPALDALRRAGKVRRIGVTGYDLQVLRRILERTAIRVDSVLTYCRYTLNDRALVEGEEGDDVSFLDFVNQRGIQLINASAIAMGLLRKEAPPVWHPASPGLKSRVVAAAKYASERDCNLARLALGFVLRDERIPTTLVSCTSVEQMDTNLSVMRDGLSSHETEVLEQVLAQFFPQSENWVGVELEAMRAKAARKLREKQEKLLETSTPEKQVLKVEPRPNISPGSEAKGDHALETKQ